MNNVELLQQLIRFPTVSSESNLDLIHYIAQLLEEKGIQVQVIQDPVQAKAALFATVGDPTIPGILLSGHSDVVPVEGQAWSVDPFSATLVEDKLFGRGGCDMKGFIAVALNLMLSLADKPLARPVHLAVSFDEELGCLGVKDMLLHLQHLKVEPLLCIVGEPTEMNIALGHKGKAAYRVHCCGEEAHSSRAPLSVNAIYLACDFIAKLRELQQQFKVRGARDDEYDIPYSTVHVGKIEGGKAINIVPQSCQFDFEIRHLAQDDLDKELTTLFSQAQHIVEAARAELPASRAEIQFTCMSRYPGLNTDASHHAIQRLKNGQQMMQNSFALRLALRADCFLRRLTPPLWCVGRGL